MRRKRTLARPNEVSAGLRRENVTTTSSMPNTVHCPTAKASSGGVFMLREIAATYTSRSRKSPFASSSGMSSLSSLLSAIVSPAMLSLPTSCATIPK